MRKPAGEMARPNPSQKRKASSFLEANTPRSILNVGGSPGVKRTSKNKATHAEACHEEQYGFAAVQSPSKKLRKGELSEEKRLRTFRKHAPKSYLERLERVRSQRMFLIDRQLKSSADGSHEEVFDIAGTTGNIYQVNIGRVPSCTCPDAQKGNQCKHIIYVSDVSIVDSLWSSLNEAYRFSSLC